MVAITVGKFIIALSFGVLVGRKVLGIGEVVVSLCVLGDGVVKDFGTPS